MVTRKAQTQATAPASMAVNMPPKMPPKMMPSVIRPHSASKLILTASRSGTVWPRGWLSR